MQYKEKEDPGPVAKVLSPVAICKATPFHLPPRH